MKKIISILLLTVTFTLVTTTKVQAQTGIHFGQTFQTVQCVNGEPTTRKITLHVDCSSKGHYALTKGKYKSSNKSVATVDKYGNVTCTGKEGVTTISIKYKGETYKTKISVITPSSFRSMAYGVIPNENCYGTTVGMMWNSSPCLGKTRQEVTYEKT